jgi:hypothetical protein
MFDLVEVLRLCRNQTRVRDAIKKVLSRPLANEPIPKEPGVRQLQRRLSADEQAQVVERYQSGETVYELGRAFTIGRTTISAILERHGIPRRYRLLGPDELMMAIELYEQQGLSLVDAGIRIGVNASTVLNAFKTAGVKTRPVGTNQWK